MGSTRSSKVLVVGGAGHVGSNLVEQLVKNKNYAKVTSLDNYSNGSQDNHVEGVEYLVGDGANIDKIVTDQYDTVVHLGEFARIEQSFDDYYHVINNNIGATASVIKYCIDTKTKLVYSASSAITSMDDPKVINSPYTILKAANVALINSLSKRYDLDFAIIYFYNVYGPREKAKGNTATVVEKFLNKKFLNESVTINPPGTQKRNFTDVRDIVDGILRVIENGAGDGYCIGSPKSYSIIELAEMIGVNYSIGPSRLGNRISSKIDTSKMNKLGWQVRFDLPDYIKKRVEKGS